jgi:hypothetical protein
MARRNRSVRCKNTLLSHTLFVSVASRSMARVRKTACPSFI